MNRPRELDHPECWVPRDLHDGRSYSRARQGQQDLAYRLRSVGDHVLRSQAIYAAVLIHSDVCESVSRLSVHSMFAKKAVARYRLIKLRPFSIPNHAVSALARSDASHISTSSLFQATARDPMWTGFGNVPFATAL